MNLKIKELKRKRRGAEVCIKRSKQEQQKMGAVKGSKKHIQKYVNSSSRALSDCLLEASPSLKAACIDSIVWVSPTAGDGFREYRDADFLRVLDLGEHAGKLTSFWPKKGPSWDALAKLKTTTRAGAIIVEAKSHLKETPRPDPSKAKNPASIEKIDSGFKRAREFFGVPSTYPSWRESHYQFCNRLAHFYFMNEIIRVPTWLVWFFITNDPDWPSDAASAEEWKRYLDDIYSEIGMPTEHKLKDRIITVFTPPLNEASG